MPAILILGVFAGLIGAAVAVGNGSSLWFAVLVYIVVGAVSTILLPILLIALGRLGIFRPRDDTPIRELDIDSSASADHGTPAQLLTAADPAKHGIGVRVH